MKKFLIGLLVFVLVVVAGGSVYLFAFEKTVPTNLVAKQVEEVKTSKLIDKKIEKVDEIELDKMSYTHEKLTYTKDGEEVKTTTEENVTMKLSKTKDGETVVFEVNSSEYDKDTKKTTTTNVKLYEKDGKYYKLEGEKETEIDENEYSALGIYFAMMVDPFYDVVGASATGELLEEIKTMIDENLEKVTQKGLKITLHLSKTEEPSEGTSVKTSYKITYNFFSKKVVALENVVETYAGDFLSVKETYTLAF